MRIEYKVSTRAKIMYAWLMNLFSKMAGNTAATNMEKQTAEGNGDVDPSQESEIEELTTAGIISTIIAAGLGVIIVILLTIYILLTPAFWFFCSMAEGQSCGVEIVFWPIGYF